MLNVLKSEKNNIIAFYKLEVLKFLNIYFNKENTNTNVYFVYSERLKKVKIQPSYCRLI